MQIEPAEQQAEPQACDVAQQAPATQVWLEGHVPVGVEGLHTGAWHWQAANALPSLEQAWEPFVPLAQVHCCVAPGVQTRATAHEQLLKAAPDDKQLWAPDEPLGQTQARVSPGVHSFDEFGEPQLASIARDQAATIARHAFTDVMTLSCGSLEFVTTSRKRDGLPRGASGPQDCCPE